MDTSGFFNYPTADVPEAPDVEFFPHGTEEEWARLLAHCEMQLFDPGQIVMQAGDAGGALYLLTEGSLEVVAPGRRGASRALSATAVFGEQSFLDGRPHAAKVQALTGGEMLRLGREAFESLCAREPRLGHAILFELGRIVSLQLRRAEGEAETGR